MQCPKCKAPMQPVATPEGEADRCSQCQGLWFDLHEHEELKAQAVGIDTGDAAVGREYNRIDRIKCPRCPDSPMIRMVDPRQPHIWFESCTTCYGRFYDAGEFQDFSEVTWRELFASLGAPARD